MTDSVVFCYYSNTAVSMAVWAVSVPLFISGILSFIGWFVGVLTIFWYGMFLFTINSFLLAMQAGMHMEFEDPMCAGHIMPGPPCITSFYITSILTMMICYYILLWKRPGSVYLLFMIFVIPVPPFVLMWFGYASIWDVFIMAYTGIFFTMIFFWFMVMYVLPDMQFMFSNSVTRWFQYTDRMFLTEEQVKLGEQDLLVTKLLHEKELEREEKRKRSELQPKVSLPEWKRR